MFVNNYFVGDNSWRPGVQDKPTVARVIDESTSRSSTAVQTAISFLGEEDKSHNLVQAGILRVKSMNNEEGNYNTKLPLVVEPTKNWNTTGWSTKSFNLPDLQQNTPTRQQCKGFPDLTVPPPPLPSQTHSPSSNDNKNKGMDDTVLRVIEKMTNTMEQQMLLNARQSEYNMMQNTKMMTNSLRIKTGET